MSEDPTPNIPTNGTSSEPTAFPSDGDSVADLKREVERLRAQLTKANADVETYRRAAYAMLEQLDPYVPPTEEELRDMVHGQRGRPIIEIIAEMERGLAGEPGVPDGRG